MNFPIFCNHKDQQVMWFRIYGYGLCLEKTPLTFSERNGYKKYLKLPFGWRVTVLRNTWL